MNEPVEQYARRYVEEAKATLEAPYLAEGIRKIAEVMLHAREQHKTIFFFGNGGSASTASHFVTDIGKSTIRGNGRRFRCLALNDNIPYITAWSNDHAYDRIFAEQLRNLAGPGDVAIAISGSGNSPNVLRAIEVAKEKGMVTVGLTGIGGGKLKGMVDVAVVVPSNSMQHTEDVHLVVCHVLTAYLRDEVEAPPA